MSVIDSASDLWRLSVAIQVADLPFACRQACAMGRSTGCGPISRKVRHSSWASASIPSPNRTPSRMRSEEHTSELQSLTNLVCRLLLEKKKNQNTHDRNTPVT